MAISIGIVELHSEFRQSLEYLISTSTDFKLIWSYSTTEEALGDGRQTDIVLLDINPQGISGIQSIPLLKQKHPLRKIMVLTFSDDDFLIFEAIKIGADGYISKKSGPGKILDHIRQVNEGEGSLSPMIARQAMEYLEPAPGKAALPSILIAQEKQILVLLIHGMSDEQIADALSINIKILRNQIKTVYDKLHLFSCSQAIKKPTRDKPA